MSVNSIHSVADAVLTIYISLTAVEWIEKSRMFFYWLFLKYQPRGGHIPANGLLRYLILTFAKLNL